MTPSVEDHLLTIAEAAEVLRVSKDWIYRNQRWKTLPFTVVLSPRKIRFSAKGIEEYIQERRTSYAGHSTLDA